MILRELPWAISKRIKAAHLVVNGEFRWYISLV